MIENNKPCRRVHSNLLGQDCYLRDTVLAFDTHSNYKGKKTYFELQTDVVEDGIRQKLVEVDYPITPVVVKSHADSCDYHVDPVGAVARSQSRQNLGDVTQVQSVLDMDSAQASALYLQLKQKFENIKQSPTPANSASANSTPANSAPTNN